MSGEGYKTGRHTRQRILDVGLGIARDDGLKAITARAIGSHVHISHTAVLYYFNGIEALRDAVAEHAIENKDARVIARLILDEHPRVTGFTSGERAEWLRAASEV
jgi:AcrR family transcriptional regulator